MQHFIDFLDFTIVATYYVHLHKNNIGQLMVEAANQFVTKNLNIVYENNHFKLVELCQNILNDLLNTKV